MYQTILDDFERRHAARIPGAFAGRQHVLLRVGSRDLAAELINQSATGFSIALPRFGARIKVGQRLLVGTRGTWHEVNVVHIEKEKKKIHIGLAIVEDCVSPHETAGLWLWLGLLATLVLATLILYETENPQTGFLHRWLTELQSRF